MALTDTHAAKTDGFPRHEVLAFNQTTYQYHHQAVWAVVEEEAVRMQATSQLQFPELLKELIHAHRSTQWFLQYTESQITASTSAILTKALVRDFVLNVTSRVARLLEVEPGRGLQEWILSDLQVQQQLDPSETSVLNEEVRETMRTASEAQIILLGNPWLFIYMFIVRHLQEWPTASAAIAVLAQHRKSEPEDDATS